MAFDRISAILLERVVSNPLARSTLLSELVRGHESCVDNDSNANERVVVLKARVGEHEGL
jgi:hypothetical protein